MRCMRKDRVLYHFVDVHDMVSFRVVDKLSMTENEVSLKMGQLNSGRYPIYCRHC